MSIVWHHQKDVRFTFAEKKPHPPNDLQKKAGAKPIFLFFPLEYGSKKSRPSQIGVPWNLGELHLSVSGTEICYRLEADWRRSPRDAWIWMLIDWTVRFWGPVRWLEGCEGFTPWMGLLGILFTRNGVTGTPRKIFRLERKKNNPPELTTGRSSEANPFIIVFQNVKAFQGV